MHEQLSVVVAAYVVVQLFLHPLVQCWLHQHVHQLLLIAEDLHNKNVSTTGRTRCRGLFGVLLDTLDRQPEEGVVLAERYETSVITWYYCSANGLPTTRGDATQESSPFRVGSLFNQVRPTGPRLEKRLEAISVLHLCL